MRSTRSGWCGLVVLLGLGVAPPARAAVFTVGDDEPAAAYHSIQEAIDAALATAGSHQIRVAAGSYAERLLLLSDDFGAGVSLSGGWNADFSARGPGIGATVVDTTTLGALRVVTVECRAGTLRLEGFTLTGGHTVRGGGVDRDAGAGGGAHLDVSGTCRVVLEDNVLYANTAEGSAADPTQGGGLYAGVRGSGRLELRDNEFVANRALNAGGFAAAGGASVFVANDGGASLLGNRIADNAVEGTGASSGGLTLSVSGRALAIVHDNTIAGNSTAATSPEFQPVILGAFINAGVNSDTVCEPCGGEIEWRRNRVEDNRDATAVKPPAHLVLVAARGARVTFSDSILAAAPADPGLLAFVSGEARVALVNLTVTRHTGTGIAAGVLDSTASLSIANSIVNGNGVDLLPTGPGVTTVRNFVVGDPLFVDPAGRDYRLRGGSVAIDAGNDSPPGGLSTRDVDGRPRVIGAHPDIGAHEAQNGQCSVTDPFPPAQSSSACRCFADPSLREFRCGFFQADLFVNLRAPWPFTPGQSFEAEWTIQPWSGATGPFLFEAFLVSGGKTTPLDKPKGPTRLIDGKSTSVSLKAIAPPDPQAIRTRLRYQLPGDKLPRETTLDAGIGPPPKL